MNAAGLHLTRGVARAVLVGDDGAVAASARVAGDDLRETARQALRQALGSGQAGAIGVAVDPLENLDITAANHGLSDLGPVVVVRAGDACVAAEAWTGAARGAQHAVCLYVGDTVFAGVLLDGRPWTGAHGLAGAAAWLALNPVDRQDYRKHGSLAAEVSYTGIAKRLAWRIHAGDRSAVLERVANPEAITASHVFEAARGGDGVSISVVRDAARFIGMAIANLAVAVDPEVAVLGGGIASAGDLVLEPVRQECLRRLPPEIASQLRCELSSLGEDAVAIGAARLAR